MGVVLRGGKIITAEKEMVSDILIEGEKITQIGKNLKGKEIIDVSGCLVLPGGIDPHTHFDLEVANTITADNFQSGTKAALVGGTTTIIDYATQYKDESLTEALESQFNKAKYCYCDFGFHMGITDWNELVSLEMQELVDSGVTSFKLYMAYKNTLQVDDGVIYQALNRSKETKGLITFHCENGDIIDVLVKEAQNKEQLEPIYHALTRPSILEHEAISRVLDIAKLTNTYVYIVHLSTGGGLQRIIEARKEGVKVLVETCPQYLLLNDNCYFNEGEKYIMSPPLRKKDDNEALWMGLKNGHINTVATDHCSFNYKGQKDIVNDFSKVPNGAPGVEHRLSLIYTYGALNKFISLKQLVQLTSTNAAKIFGLYPQKGTIAVGSDADIVVIDPKYSTVIKASKQTQNVDYTPYEGFKKMGKIRYVFLRGKKLVENDELINENPYGQFIKRRPFEGSEINV